MKIIKSQCRFPVFVYLGGQLHQGRMKLDSAEVDSSKNLICGVNFSAKSTTLQQN